MKNLLLIFFLLLLTEATGQYSISVGINRKMENPTNSDNYPFSSWSTADKRFKNDYFNIRGDYQKDWLFLSAEISGLFKKGVVSNVSYTITHSPTDYHHYNFFAKANYSYLGLKLGPSYLLYGDDPIFEKLTSGFAIGPFVQTEFLVSHTEYDHLINGKSGYDFAAMDLEQVFVSYGVRILKRFTYKGVFIEANASAGHSAKNRTGFRKDKDERSHSNLFYEIGFSVGYTRQLKPTKSLDP